MASPPPPLPLEALNGLDDTQFNTHLAGVFEHSPWVVAATAHGRPFGSLAALHQALCDTLRAAPAADQLALLRAHPELAGREAQAGKLTAESTSEQRGAGLDQCSAEEFARLQALNAAYREKFGFPFVMAVKGRARAEILAAFEARLHNSPEQEFARALDEVGRITLFRLAALVADPS